MINNELDFKLYIIRTIDLEDNYMAEYEYPTLTQARETMQTLANSSLRPDRISLYGYSKGDYYFIESY